MKRVFLMAMVALVAVCGLGVFATTDSASAAERELSGRGVLYARGAGLAAVEGDGCVEIRSYGVGTVAITGAERRQRQSHHTQRRYRGLRWFRRDYSRLR